MALKPTIFKMNINVSNLDDDVYESIALTIAQHPSETTERMASRVLAYVLNNQEFLSFTKGLSEVDDPDIWAKNYSDEFLLWIDVGEPAFERMRKACQKAKQVKLYTFNTKSGVWWKQSKKDEMLINPEYKVRYSDKFTEKNYNNINPQIAANSIESVRWQCTLRGGNTKKVMRKMNTDLDGKSQ